MERSLRVASVGLGAIGRAAARLLAEKRTLRLVGAADLDPARQGTELGALLGLDRELGVRVEGEASAMLAHERPDAVVLCTASRVPEVLPSILEALAVGAHVVSPCEELLLPDFAHPELAREIDAAAQRAGAGVLGIGVNPGFVLDYLAVIGSGVCARVRSVHALRVVDALTRRPALRAKIGAGRTAESFRELAAAGGLGHVGLKESAALIGRALGFELDEVTQRVEPVLAERDLETPEGRVLLGRVAGLRDVARGLRRGDPLVELQLEMCVGARDPRDEITLVGEPEVRLRAEGGIPGDQATAALLVNSIHRLAAATPGLKTVLDLPPPRPAA